MNSMGPMNFFRTTDTIDTTIWKPGFKPPPNEQTKGLTKTKKGKEKSVLRNQADISSVSPSPERNENFCVVCCSHIIHTIIHTNIHVRKKICQWWKRGR